MSLHASRIARNFVSLLVLAAILPAVSFACLWDHDTVQQERSRFPKTLELITGKFLRHSPEFYEWRIKDRLAKLKAEPENLAYHDDLAVAYSKVGRHTDAITVMQAKEKLKPGLYETYSNLGTFYILAGDFAAGLPWIDRALAINPDAHFGREKYQKWLVEYALTRRASDGTITFPLRSEADPEHRTFYGFVAEKLGAKVDGKPTLTPAGVQGAVKAVLGMMRFADHDNPLLLEALGDLLKPETDDPKDGKQLAARCYLAAAAQMKTPDARRRYREFALSAVRQATVAKPERPEDWLDEKAGASWKLEEDFRFESADAERWYAELKAKELGWIQAGKNADAEFDRLYKLEPPLPPSKDPKPQKPATKK